MLKRDVWTALFEETGVNKDCTLYLPNDPKEMKTTILWLKKHMYVCVNSLIYLMKLHVPPRLFDRLTSSDRQVICE